jgi:gentisate 1,2-dioxygenase
MLWSATVRVNAWDGRRTVPPGARTASHSHALGQALHVTEGLGVVQTRDGQVLTMHPGDTRGSRRPARGVGTAPSTTS